MLCQIKIESKCGSVYLCICLSVSVTVCDLAEREEEDWTGIVRVSI